MTDCEAHGHPNVGIGECPCGAVTYPVVPPAAYPPVLEPPTFQNETWRRPDRRRTAPTIPYRPRALLSRPAPRVQRVVYP